MDKDSIRKSVLAKRLSMRQEEIIEKSRLITQKLNQVESLNQAENVSVYLAVNNEVDTKEIIDNLLQNKRDVYLPAYLKNQYFFVKFLGWQELEKGPYGIFQPENPKIIDPKTIEVAIIPGIAFSKSGLRIGYGQGVFDRLLGGSGAFKIGLAYEFQMVKDHPLEDHDLLVNMAVTEEKIYAPKSKSLG